MNLVKALLINIVHKFKNGKMALFSSFQNFQNFIKENTTSYCPT